MKKQTYYTPETEVLRINLEKGLLIGSVTEDTGIPDLIYDDFTDIFAIF